MDAYPQMIVFSIWQDDDEGEVWCGNDHEATSEVCKSLERMPI